MRKIIPPQVEEKNAKRKKIFVGVMLIGLMLLSTIAYAFQMIFNSATSDAKSIKYNGFDFVFQNGFWILGTNIGNFIFSYNPNEVRKIPGLVNGINEYNGGRLYLYSESPEAESEIRINLGQMASSIENACLEGTGCNSSTLIKNCNENFIIIKEGIEKIEQNGKCVFLQGNKNDLLKIADEFLLKILKLDP